MDEHRFNSADSFIGALVQQGITKAAVAITDEKRNIRNSPDQYQVQHVHQADFIAYKNSVIYKYTAHVENIKTTEELIIQHGIELTRRDRNII